MNPSAAPGRTRVRIYARWGIDPRFRVDKLFFDHDPRRRYSDGATNHDGSEITGADRSTITGGVRYSYDRA
jgi:hypothetical protein